MHLSFNHVTSPPVLGIKKATIVTNEELRKMREDISGNKGQATREAAIITREEIERMKRSTKIMSVQEKKEQAKIEEEMK